MAFAFFAKRFSFSDLLAAVFELFEPPLSLLAIVAPPDGETQVSNVPLLDGPLRRGHLPGPRTEYTDRAGSNLRFARSDRPVAQRPTRLSPPRISMIQKEGAPWSGVPSA